MEQRPDVQHPSSIEDRLVDNLRDLDRRMRFRDEGKNSQMQILILLMETAPVTQRDLTEQLGIQPGSASEILAKIERTGAITRTQNAEDRRTRIVDLTESGRKQAQEALERQKNRHQEMFRILSDEEKQTLFQLTKKLCGAWQTAAQQTVSDPSEREA